MINIAIDEPAGAGKSTIAKKLAEKMGIIYLDTGAMYRACAYSAGKNNVSVHDAKAVVELMDTLKLDISYDENGTQTVFVNGETADEYLETGKTAITLEDFDVEEAA